MITTNEQKKNLISKLLEEKHITIDDAFMLLDEQAPVSQPVYPQKADNPFNVPIPPYSPYIAPPSPRYQWYPREAYPDINWATGTTTLT